MGEAFWAGVKNADEFFAGVAPVQKATEKLVARLKELGIDHALLGGMAIYEYGYLRVTDDVDVLLNAEGLERLKGAWLGKDYVERKRGLRDTAYDVNIDVVLSGTFPGDRLPKPIVFPEPVSEAGLLPYERFVELKLASGMTAPHRLKDLADVIVLIQLRDLPAEFESRLHDYVRPKYRELWAAAQHRDEE